MLVEVALPVPVLKNFTYAVPPEYGARATPGSRVLVPFGRGEKLGWFDRVVEGPSDDGVRPLTAVVDAAPSVSPTLLRLCRWAADYYIAPPGLVLRAALPAAMSV